MEWRQTELLRRARRYVILVLGVTLFLLGVLLVFIPGPGILVLLLALAVLATEFIWAKHFLSRMKEKMTQKKS